MLFDRFQNKFRSLIILKCPVTFAPAILGDDVGIIGAAMLAGD